MTMDRVMMAHGSGGTMMRGLIDEVFLPAFGQDASKQGDDSFVTELAGPPARIALSTDTFVVTPRFFPGGDIGRLAVCGTVNDVATSGARVLYLACGFVLEEGLPLDELRAVVRSMAEAAREAGVAIVTGDTKVVERGGCDGLYISTTGVGVIERGATLSGRNCRAGDRVLLSGTLGDHGIAVMSCREGLGFKAAVGSDVAPLNGLVSAVLDAAPHARCFRDPTRGGLASALNELAAQSSCAIEVEEERIPVTDQVRGCCDLLGLDVLQVANEGKMVCVVPEDEADAALAAMKASRYGENAALIGEVLEPRPFGASAPVTLRTGLGARRIMDAPVGEQLPRIC